MAVHHGPKSSAQDEMIMEEYNKIMASQDPGEMSTQEHHSHHRPTSSAQDEMSDEEYRKMTDQLSVEDVERLKAAEEYCALRRQQHKLYLNEKEALLNEKESLLYQNELLREELDHMNATAKNLMQENEKLRAQKTAMMKKPAAQKRPDVQKKPAAQTKAARIEEAAKMAAVGLMHNMVFNETDGWIPEHVLAQRMHQRRQLKEASIE